MGWKSTVSAILYPIKFILIQPLSFLAKDPDPAPPVLVIAFTFYWAMMALVLHLFLSKTIIRKKYDF